MRKSSLIFGKEDCQGARVSIRNNLPRKQVKKWMFLLLSSPLQERPLHHPLHQQVQHRKLLLFRLGRLLPRVLRRPRLRPCRDPLLRQGGGRRGRGQDLRGLRSQVPGAQLTGPPHSATAGVAAGTEERDRVGHHQQQEEEEEEEGLRVDFARPRDG